MNAEWWKNTAWPWLRKNWWKVLFFPIGIVLFFAGYMSRGKGNPEDIAVDPLREADRRAAEEETARKLQLEQENERYRDELQKMHEEREALMRQLSDEQRARYETLKDDPQALNAWLLSLQNRRR